MKKIPFKELEANMMRFNKEHPDKQDTTVITGVIVFKQENWPDHLYSVKDRSYRVSNANHAF